jgi:hypothetical protein
MAKNPETFVYVKIPEGIGPIARGDKYEDPLDRKLRAEGVGEVSGGGQQLGHPQADGTQIIEFCGVDIDVNNFDQSLVLIRDELPRLGAPLGTELHYTRNGVALQDELQCAGWAIGRPRTFRHPAFEC